MDRSLISLLLPPAAPLLVILLGLLWWRHHARLALALLWMGTLAVWLLSTPAIVSMLLTPLETPTVFDPAQGREAGAIVILGGGRYGWAAEYGGPTVNDLTLVRLRYGARLARRTRLPILLSGGLATPHNPAEAILMARSLREDFGLQPRWLETRSRNTSENAVFSAQLLRQAGIRRIVLVTHAAHMPRARKYFEAAGLIVVAAPTVRLAGLSSGEPGGDWLPSARAAFAAWYGLHEWLGLAQQTLYLRYGWPA